jgi:hypothetical protein
MHNPHVTSAQCNVLYYTESQSAYILSKCATILTIIPYKMYIELSKQMHCMSTVTSTSNHITTRNRKQLEVHKYYALYKCVYYGSQYVQYISLHAVVCLQSPLSTSAAAVHEQLNAWVDWFKKKKHREIANNDKGTPEGPTAAVTSCCYYASHTTTHYLYYLTYCCCCCCSRFSSCHLTSHRSSVFEDHSIHTHTFSTTCSCDLDVQKPKLLLLLLFMRHTILRSTRCYSVWMLWDASSTDARTAAPALIAADTADTAAAIRDPIAYILGVQSATAPVQLLLQ